MTGRHREVVSSAAGLAAFGAILAIDTSPLFLFVAVLTGIIGYGAPRLLIPRTRDFGEAVTEATIDHSRMTEADLAQHMLEQGRRFDDWLKGEVGSALKDRPEVAKNIEDIRTAIRASFAHLETDTFGVRTFAVTMNYYLGTFESSLRSYLGFLAMEHMNTTIRAAIDGFEHGLKEMYQAFDAVFSVLVKRDIERLEELRRGFGAVMKMKKILGETP